MKSYVKNVSERKDGKLQVVGKVEFHYPLLSEMGWNVEPTGEDEEGLPTYEDAKVQFVFDSCFNTTYAMVRSRLEPGTATLKAGNKIPTTVEELLESNTANRGKALQLRREFLDGFRTFVVGLKKSEKMVNLLVALASSKEALAVQDDDKKAKFHSYVQDFSATLTPEKLVSYEKILEKIEEACESSNAWE